MRWRSLPFVLYDTLTYVSCLGCDKFRLVKYMDLHFLLYGIRGQGLARRNEWFETRARAIDRIRFVVVGRRQIPNDV